MQYQAIIPKRYTDAAAAQKKVDELLKRFAVEAQRELQTYPAWRPWKNPPTSGPRAGGKRTGDLGRGWEHYTLVSGHSVTLENRVSYSPYVQGPKGTQARALAERGWPQIDEVGKRAAKKAVSQIDLKP